MKRCARGNHQVDESCFYRHPTHPDGLSSSCKACLVQYARERRAAGKVKSYYVRGKYKYNPVYTEEQKAHRAAMDKQWHTRQRWVKQSKLVDYFLAHPCVDCGEADPLVLELDHVRGVKLMSVSEMIAQCMPWPRIELEVAKCESRCANCHKRVTAIRGSQARFVILAERDAELKAA
jgi:hypothetical protein